MMQQSLTKAFKFPTVFKTRQRLVSLQQICTLEFCVMLILGQKGLENNLLHFPRFLVYAGRWLACTARAMNPFH